MKIVNRQPRETADISAARHTAVSEFWKLVLSAIILLITLYFAIGFTVDLMVSRISFENEARIFNAFSFDDLPVPESDDGDKLQKAQEILDVLIGTGQAPPLPYSLKILEMDEPNAFAFPGGGIGMTTGLLEMLDDEIEIAFVLGHELGHFHHRDHLRGFGRTTGFSLVIIALFGSSSGAESLGNIMNASFQRTYSQNREQDADRFGLNMVHSAYGRTAGIEHLFKIFDEHDDVPEWGYMFATHPSPKSRIRDLEKFAAELE